MTNEERVALERVALIKTEILTDISNHKNDFTYDIEDFYRFDILGRTFYYICKDSRINLLKITQLIEAFDMDNKQVEIYTLGNETEDLIVSFTDIYCHFSWEDNLND